MVKKNPNKDGDKDGGEGAKDPVKGENTLKWHQRLPLNGAAKTLGIVLLVITGIAFLPAMLNKAGTDLMFNWLPKEYRPMACGAASFTCCCSSCCAASLAIYMAMKK